MLAKLRRQCPASSPKLHRISHQDHNRRANDLERTTLGTIRPRLIRMGIQSTQQRVSQFYLQTLTQIFLLNRQSRGENQAQTLPTTLTTGSTNLLGHHTV